MHLYQLLRVEQLVKDGAAEAFTALSTSARAAAIVTSTVLCRSSAGAPCWHAVLRLPDGNHGQLINNVGQGVSPKHHRQIKSTRQLQTPRATIRDFFLGIVTASAKHAFVSGETSVRNLAEIPEWMPGPAERKQKY